VLCRFGLFLSRPCGGLWSRLRLHWRISGGSISLALEFPASVGWAALGWSPSGHMVGALAVVGQAAAGASAGQVGVYHLTAKSAAGLQPSDAIPLAQAQLVRQGEQAAFMR
jgi:hypothetical protein